MALPNNEDMKLDHIGPEIDRIITAASQPPQNLAAAIRSLRLFRLTISAVECFEDAQFISKEDDENFIQASNDVFFGGTLFDYAPEIHLKWTHQPKEVRKAWEESWDSEYFQICVNTAKVNSALEVISVLLHELCHVVIDALYRREQALERKISIHLVGRSGHSYFWQRLARAVEYRAKQVIHPVIDLERAPGVLTEVRASGALPMRSFYQAIFGGEVHLGRPAPEVHQKIVERRYAELGFLAEAVAFCFEDELERATESTGGV